MLRGYRVPIGPENKEDKKNRARKYNLLGLNTPPPSPMRARGASPSTPAVVTVVASQEKKEKAVQPTSAQLIRFNQLVADFYVRQKATWLADLKEMDENYIDEHPVRVEKAVLLSVKEMIDVIVKRRMNRHTSDRQAAFVRVVTLILEISYGRFSSDQSHVSVYKKQLENLERCLSDDEMPPREARDLEQKAYEYFYALPAVTLSEQQHALLLGESLAAEKLKVVETLFPTLTEDEAFFSGVDDRDFEVLRSFIQKYHQNFYSATVVLDNIKKYLTEIKRCVAFNFFESIPSPRLIDFYKQVLRVIDNSQSVGAAPQRQMEMKRV